MTIKRKLSMGIGVLMTLFLALGVISYFQIGQIDDNLAEIIQGKTLGKRAVLLHQRCKTLDAALTRTKDVQNALFAKVTGALARLEATIGEELPGTTVFRRQGEHGWTDETSRMDREIAKIAGSLAVYLRTPIKEHKQQVLNDVAIVERRFGRLKNLPLTEQQNNSLNRIESQVNQAVSLVKEIVALNSHIGDKAAELGGIRAELDGLMGEDFEVFSRTDLERAKEAGRKMVETKVAITLILILTGLLDVFVFSAATTRSITRPLIRLKNATTEIGRGKFDTEIEIESNDEIGQLAAAFKQMAQQRKRAEDELREARDDLETRVDLRTAELVQANEIMESEIRERKKAERSLEKLNRDLEASVGELMRSNKELQEFSYIAAHDLKTPLRGIATLADWISTDHTDKLDEEGKQHVSLLLARARQMDAMVDGVLQYSSIRQCERKRQQIDLNATLSEVIASMQVPKQVQISIESELPVLICERAHITNVFRSLLDNAIEHGAQSDGQVKIGCIKQGSFWRFSVSDNGPGIEKKYFKKIFRIFETLSPREQGESTGIGLSIVRKTVELNGGSVWVESERGKGSTFYFTLPMHMTAPNAKSRRADAVR